MVSYRYYQAIGGKTKVTASGKCDIGHICCVFECIWLAVVKGGVFAIMGTFCEAFPEHMAEYSVRLISMYMKALKEQVM